MQVIPIKTHKITVKDKDLLKVLDKYLLKLEDRSILAITSKIVSITEGRMVKMDGVDKGKLIRQESQFYLPRNENPYQVSLTITKNTLVATAGIDESNGNGYYIFWPRNPQESANKIREYLKKRFSLKNVGVIITDSKTTPLRWGVTAIAIGFSGFKPLKDYIGKKDIFGRRFEFEKLSIIDSLASAASVSMGEGVEQMPMAVISDLPFVEFQNRNPTEKELKELKIKMEEDLYGPFLQNVKWRKGFGF